MYILLGPFNSCVCIRHRSMRWSQEHGEYCDGAFTWGSLSPQVWACPAQSYHDGIWTCFGTESCGHCQTFEEQFTIKRSFYLHSCLLICLKSTHTVWGEHLVTVTCLYTVMFAADFIFWEIKEEEEKGESLVCWLWVLTWWWQDWRTHAHLSLLSQVVLATCITCLVK